MSKKTKVPIFIISGKSPLEATGGGYSSFAFNLAKIVKKLGHPVYIVALGSETKRFKIETGELCLFNFPLPIININTYALPGLPLFSLIFAFGINKISDEYKYNNIIIWGVGPWGLAGSLLKMFSRRKVILYDNYFTTIRHEWWGGVKALKIKDYGLWPKIKYLTIYLTVVQFLAVFEKILLKNANKIITNYHSTEKILNNEFGIKFQKFLHVHSYIQIYKRKKAGLYSMNHYKTPPKYLFFFSRQDPRKGVNFLLRAMEILKTEGHKIPLIIVGGGDMLNQNIKLAKKLKIEKYVKFLGFVNDPKQFMKGCAAFIFPSIEEGSSALAVNEAMEMGLPIISTACDGIPEDIENEMSGILVPKENPEALALAIKRIWNDPVLAKKLGQNARRRYKKRFNLNLMKQELGQLL